MKKTVMLIVFVLMIACSVTVMASDSFDSSEYANAATISGSDWNSFEFNNDILIKIDMSGKNSTTVFEISADGYNDTMQYFMFTETSTSLSTQNNVIYLPGYIGVPHISNSARCYIKIGYDNEYNSALKGKTLKVRMKAVTNNTEGWEKATKISLNEEHWVDFDNMNDNKWFKLVVPDEQFKYTFTVKTPGGGCFISELYSEEELKAGADISEFSDCVGADLSTITITAQMGKGTYYIHLYPTPFDADILNARIVFATDNKDSNEVVETSFGAKVSTWALDEVEKAYKNGLIPKDMEKADLTKKINRGEFAAVAVKLYGQLSNQMVGFDTNIEIPFKDIEKDVYKGDYKRDIEIAYQYGITKGMSDTTFEPDTFIDREQLATMLCRVMKKYMLSGWTLADDAKFPLEYSKTNLFADDGSISDWARESVYYMSENGIIKGVGDGKFAPKNMTDYEKAMGYADATREEAMLLSQRIFMAQND